MNKLFAFFIVSFLLLIPFPLFPQSYDEQTESVSEDSGSYPAEIPGTGGNQITAPVPEPSVRAPRFNPQVSKDLHIASQTQNETRPNYYVMEGYVDLIYKGMRLQADHAEYDAVTKDLIATGNVVLDQESQHLTGDRLELNLDTTKGVMYNARGFVPPQIFFWGSKLEKLDEDTYKLHDGVFTECSQIAPHWRLKTTTSKMTVDEYIHFKNFTLKAKNIPIFYSPYMMWPIKRDRATGFLFPSFGPNSQKGFWVQPSFFWAMNRSMDSTYWVDHYALRGWGGGGEYRYASGEESNGFFKGQVMDDALLGTEWTADGVIRQELPSYFRVAGVADYFSSYDYIRDYARTLQGALRQTRTAQVFLTRNWSYYSLNFLTDWQERQIGSRDIGSSFYHIPEIEFQSRSQKLGPTPFFVSLLSSADLLGATNRFGIGSSIDYQRYDFFPGISFPITYLSWFTITPTFGERVTYYSKQQAENNPVDEPLTRTYHDATLDLRGPNFGKIFDTPNSSYSKKWKHAIEPQITFRYIQDIPEKTNILFVDDVDEVFGVKEVTYSITNLLYSKRPVKEEEEYEPDEYQYYNPKPLEEPVESAWEFISWRIQQSYRFESDSFSTKEFADLKSYSPISSVIRVNPKVNYSVDFTTDYDLDFNQVTRITLRSSLRNLNKWYNNISYTYSNPTPGVRLPGVPRAVFRAGNSIQTNAGVGLWKNRLVLNGDAGYNITERTLLSGTVGLTYNDDCFSVGVQYKYFSDAFRFGGDENQFTFSISLPNIGNLVNFQSGAPQSRF